MCLAMKKSPLYRLYCLQYGLFGCSECAEEHTIGVSDDYFFLYNLAGQIEEKTGRRVYIEGLNLLDCVNIDDIINSIS